MFSGTILGLSVSLALFVIASLLRQKAAHEGEAKRMQEKLLKLREAHERLSAENRDLDREGRMLREAINKLHPK